MTAGISCKENRPKGVVHCKCSRLSVHAGLGGSGSFTESFAEATSSLSRCKDTHGEEFITSSCPQPQTLAAKEPMYVLGAEPQDDLRGYNATLV